MKLDKDVYLSLLHTLKMKQKKKHFKKVVTYIRKYKLDFISNNSKFLEEESTILDFTEPSKHLLLQSIIKILHK